MGQKWVTVPKTQIALRAIWIFWLNSNLNSGAYVGTRCQKPKSLRDLGFWPNVKLVVKQEVPMSNWKSVVEVLLGAVYESREYINHRLTVSTTDRLATSKQAWVFKYIYKLNISVVPDPCQTALDRSDRCKEQSCSLK